MAEAEEQAAGSAMTDESAAWLERLSGLLVEPGCNVLDLGCGDGFAAQFFVGRHHYVGVDRPGDAIARARARHPDATFIEADYARLRLPQGFADAVLAYGIVDELDSDVLTRVLQRARRCVRPGGYVLTRGCESVDTDRSFTVECSDAGTGDSTGQAWPLARRIPARAARRRQDSAVLVERLMSSAPLKERVTRRNAAAKPTTTSAGETTRTPMPTKSAKPAKFANSTKPRKSARPPKPAKAPKVRGPSFSPRGVPWSDPWMPADAAAVEVGVVEEGGTGAVTVDGRSQVRLVGWTEEVLPRQLEFVKSVDARIGRPAMYRFENAFYDTRWECLFDEQGRRIDESTPPRYPGLSGLNTGAPETIELPEDADRIDRPALFIGPFAASKHWGVFLTEGISRLWVLRRESALVADSVLIGPKAKWWVDPGRPSYVDRFLPHADLDADRFHKLERPVWLNEVYIPHPTFALLGQVFSEHTVLPELVAERICGDTMKQSEQPVYLTRRALPPDRSRVDNEHDVETYLAERGVKVVSPETLDFEEQVRLVNTHSTFIGCIGSAFHSLLYTLPDRHVRTIVVTPGTDHFANYAMIDLIKRIDATYVYTEPLAVRGVKLGGQQDGRAIVEQFETLGLF